ncbi:unnamed protein product, partial [Rotaria magnacalcarata]
MIDSFLELVAPPPGKWNSSGSTTSGNFSAFRSSNNNENNNPNSSSSSEGFGSRNTGGFNSNFDFNMFQNNTSFSIQGGRGHLVEAVVVVVEEDMDRVMLTILV